MPDDDLKPLTDADIAPAAPATTATTDFDVDPAHRTNDGGSDTDRTDTDGAKPKLDAKQAIRDGASKAAGQATEKLRAYADDGKERAGSALDQLSQLLTDAAAQVDGKLGEQYGQYARSAADQVQGFADTVRNKDVDALIDDARGFVKASPGVAIGIAAALGFVVARLVQAGVETRDQG
ncbi:hypothetical protein GCM10022268_22490 [Sphingomonas cynarae]|uniref:DUF883 family protein n=1 Tax=Sphingomonas cynarae TaxID=930197 RepID=A0ABP7E4G9_9SPHN